MQDVVDAGIAGKPQDRASGCSVSVTSRGTTAASLELNGIPSLESVLVTSPARLSGASVRIRIDGLDAPAWEAAVEPLSDGGTVEIDASGFLLPVPLLRRSNERESVDLLATLVDSAGNELAHDRCRLAVLPSSHWVGLSANAPSLAAFATSNAAATHELLRAAARILGERTGSTAIDGYLSGSPERAQRIAEACYEALAACGVTYKVMTTSFESEGQKVRTIAEVVGDRLGNCLDLSIALAALLEACGLAPVVIAGAGHAVVGFSTLDGCFPEPVHEGASRVLNRVELGEMRVVESTIAASGGDFGAALATGEEWLRTVEASARSDVHVIDLRAARRAGYHPLPEILAEAERRSAVAGHGGGARGPRAPWTPALPPNLAPLPARKLSPQEARLETWKKKLLDLTLRNRLLNDRDSAGIPLFAEGDDVLAALEDLLWDETPLRLLARSGMRGLDEGAVRAELARRWLRSTLEDAELFKRATKAYRDAISSMEESGARSLYVAIGFLEHRVEGRPAPVRSPLLLVPVEMRRISRAEGYAIRATTDETVANVALVEYLRLSHRLDLGLDGALGEDEKGIDVPALLARVRQKVRDVPGATVVAAAKLGIYSFKKLPLFEEMRLRAKDLLGHPVVRTFLERRTTPAIAASRLMKPEETERAAAFATLRLPLPADSSQLAAVVSAADGGTFVLQGPPGTGKSQTITNLLCECLARGKRVLFIAEKAAALEVVAERLDRCGLGTFALDLHAEHATKAEFVAQLKSALAGLEERAAPGARQFAQVGIGIDRERLRLHAACDALHAAGDGLASVYDAAERTVAARDGAPAAAAAGLAGALDAALPAELGESAIAERLDAVAALASAIDALPAGTASALSDVGCPRALHHEDALGAGAAARALRARLATAVGAAGAVADAIGAPRPSNLEGMQRLAAVAEAIDVASPAAAELAEAACAPDHAARLARVGKAAELAEAARAAGAALESGFDRSILEAPFAAWIGDLRAARERFILFRFLATRRVRGALARFARTPLPKDPDGLVAALEGVAKADAAIRAAIPFADALAPFGGSSADLGEARAAAERAGRLARAVRSAFPREHGAMGPGLATAIRGGALAPLVETLREALAALAAAEAELLALLEPAPALLAGSATPAEAEVRLERLATHAERLPAWSAVCVARAETRRLGLAPLADALVSGALAPRDAERAAEHEMLAGWIRGRLRTKAALADAASDRMTPIRERFSEAMAGYRRGAAAAIATVARDRASEALATAPNDPAMRAAVRTLDEIRALTSIRRPIRRVMREAAPAIAALKPIVLASPLSAATMLPPDFPAFDLVVFDEASQVPTWDAACAISRGLACVIVGDSRQLPPTNFFDRKAGADDAAPAADEAQLADALEPLDSLLDEAIASGVAERSLLWHYRSRDERLIEFSNRRSYEGRLQTFPAARRAHPNLGVEFRFVGGVYDRGGKATNRVEADEVVREIRRRLLDDDACTANRSIGVVTFSEAQQTLVQDLLDEALDADATLRERMAEAARAGEEVFVKNLENVQGDERATMIFSICYGRDASGAVHHNFGPLNLSGGERRLNVATTRAREKIILVTSVRASDLDPTKCASKGARDLRDYLSYAELGTLPAVRGAGGGVALPDPSPAERLLASRLEGRGWKVDLHVGRSRDYRVGLALADARAPEAWILGIELDGAFHRAAPTVIDRELVRDGVLAGSNGLGWRLLRVSILDVLRDVDAVVERIDAAARGG